MRTLEQQGLNRNEDTSINSATNAPNYAFAQFKNESAYMAQDGTQLVEQNGLADVYYAMRHLLKLAAITPNNLTEALQGYRITDNKYHPSQIVAALFTLFASATQLNGLKESLNDFQQGRNRRVVEVIYTVEAASQNFQINADLFGGMANVRALSIFARTPNGYYRNFSIELNSNYTYAAGGAPGDTGFNICQGHTNSIVLPLDATGTWRIYITIETI